MQLHNISYLHSVVLFVCVVLLDQESNSATAKDVPLFPTKLLSVTF